MSHDSNDENENELEEYTSKIEDTEIEEEIEEEEGEDFLNKNSKSFQCLVQLIVSHSSIFRDPYYVFPPLKDPQLDDAILYVPPDPIIDDVGAEEYIKNCNELKIVPISRIIKSLPSNILNLKYYGLTHSQIRALAPSLKINKHVEDLILQDNWLSVDSVQLLSKALTANDTIKYLNLRECRIGPIGAEEISDGLMFCRSLKYLDLSFNSLGDAGLEALSDVLINNETIVQLDLSHNKLGDGAGEAFIDILKFNKSILDLNLSWNDFYTPVAMKGLGKGLLENDTIQSLNMSWNAISTAECTTPLLKYLKKNKTIEFIDLSNNRLTDTSLAKIRLALKKSKSLLAAKLGNNPIKPDEAETVVKAFIDSKSLKFLDLENIFFEKSFIPLWDKLKYLNKSINFGGIYSNYVIKGPDELKLLFDRAIAVCLKPKSKKKQKNFGHVVLQLPSKEDFPRTEYDKFVKKQKIKMVDKDLMNAIVQKFSGKNKSVNAIAFKDAYMRYFPDTQLPPPKKKGKGKKKGKAAKKALKSLNDSEYHEEVEENISIMSDVTPVQIKAGDEVTERSGTQAVPIGQEEGGQLETSTPENEPRQATDSPATEAAPESETVAETTPETQVGTKRASESEQGGNPPK